MPKLFEELEMLCDADKRKSTNELPFVSAHMLHDLYLRWTAKHNRFQRKMGGALTGALLFLYSRENCNTYYGETILHKRRF